MEKLSLYVVKTFNDFLLCFCLNASIKSIEDNADYNLIGLWKNQIFDVHFECRIFGPFSWLLGFLNTAYVV